MMSEIVLSYHNSLLRRSDVNLLNSPNWLNDRIIGFWFEYLENDIADDSICLISPEVAQFIKLGSPADTSMFVVPLNLNSRSLILLPVNDSISLEQPGGSHWSLLIYDCMERRYYHLDSLNGGNLHQAKKMAHNLGLSKEEVVELETAPQQNFYDCGVFVCCNAEHVINHCQVKKGKLKSLPLLSQEVVIQQRKRMLQIVSKLSHA